MAVAVWSAGSKGSLSVEGVCRDGLVMSATGTSGGAWLCRVEGRGSVKWSLLLHHQGECLLVVIVLPPSNPSSSSSSNTQQSASVTSP